MNSVHATSKRSWVRTMLETPASPPSPLSRYIFWNGVLYLVAGVALYALPERFAIEPFSGREEGYLRALGIVAAAVGWLYMFGARTRSNSFALATIADRLAVPVLVLPLYFTGQVGAVLAFAFALGDPLLALGAYVIWRRYDSAHQ